MKIWIDITNSPEPLFFDRLVKELSTMHEIVITCRPLANTLELLDLHELPYHVVGSHYGKSKVRKSVGFVIRIIQLFGFLRGKGIDIAISHSSFYSPVVAKLLNIPSIYLNDNEHAAGNRISFFFATRIMIPEFLNIEKVKRQGASVQKVIQFPGVKEGIYLWDYKPTDISEFPLSRSSDKKVIFVRPEPWAAQYYSAATNFIDTLLIDLKERFEVVLLPRGEQQIRHYRQARFAGVVVLEKSVSLVDVMENCDLFIGAGGTMTREAAVLGVPTISIYQDEQLDVDLFLIENHAMIHERNLTAERVVRFLEGSARRPPNRDLLAKGRQAYDLIKETLLALGSTPGERTRDA